MEVRRGSEAERIAELQRFLTQWKALEEMLAYEVRILSDGTARPEDIALMDLDADEINFQYYEPSSATSTTASAPNAAPGGVKGGTPGSASTAPSPTLKPSATTSGGNKAQSPLLSAITKKLRTMAGSKGGTSPSVPPTAGTEMKAPALLLPPNVKARKALRNTSSVGSALPSSTDLSPSSLDPNSNTGGSPKRTGIVKTEPALVVATSASSSSSPQKKMGVSGGVAVPGAGVPILGSMAGVAHALLAAQSRKRKHVCDPVESDSDQQSVTSATSSSIATTVSPASMRVMGSVIGSVQTPQKSAANASRTLLQRLWRDICAADRKHWFRKPVTEADAVGYSAVIKRPMSLDVIKERIDSGVITRVVQLQRDVELMCLNAQLFNPPTHDAWSEARLLRTQCRKCCYQALEKEKQLLATLGVGGSGIAGSPFPPLPPPLFDEPAPPGQNASSMGSSSSSLSSVPIGVTSGGSGSTPTSSPRVGPSLAPPPPPFGSTAVAVPPFHLQISPRLLRSSRQTNNSPKTQEKLK